MGLLAQLENELRTREDGWWMRLSDALPELTPLADTQQPPEYHAEGNVAIHTRLAIETCPSECDPDLLWVALLHDIGKPATTQKTTEGRITAYGHAKLGAELAKGVLDRIEMPTFRCKRIVWVIRHHIFHHAWQLKSAGELTNRHRTYMKNPDFPLLLEFLRVDTTASHGRIDKMQDYEFYRNLWAELTNK